MALFIKHEFEVNADTATVWNVISDLARYGEWNPFVTQCSSSKQVGDPIHMRVKVLPFYAQPQTEFVSEHIAGKKFAYRMKPLPMNLLHSQRFHEVRDLGNGKTLYTSSFQLEGVFSGFVQLLLGRQLKRGFNEMCAALKIRAEQ